MTEPNNYTIFLSEQDAEQPAGRRHRRAKHLKKSGGKRLFRLGVSCLALLLVTSLVLVSGSFSQFSSGPSNMENFPNLTVAAFGVEVRENAPYDPEEEYDADHIVLYSFTIDNTSSQVPIICDITFNVEIKGYYIGGAGEDFDKLDIFLGMKLITKS